MTTSSYARNENYDFNFYCNNNGYFDLIIFDLDDTLLETWYLENYRGKDNLGQQPNEYYEGLKKYSKEIVQYFPEHELLNARNKYPNIKLAVLTRSPRCYATTLLEIWYPKIEWSAIIAYEDVSQHKPHPEGIFTIMKLLKLTNKSRVLMIGDTSSDILAAHRAGVKSMLFTRGHKESYSHKNKKSVNDQYICRNQVPDFVKTYFLSALKCLDNPEFHKPSLEISDVFDCDSSKLRFDIISKKIPLQLQTEESFLYINIGSRYTSKKSYRTQNKTSHDLLNAKTSGEYPKKWISILQKFLENRRVLKRYINHRFIVTCAPPSTRGNKGDLRLKNLLDQICKITPKSLNIEFNPDMFCQTEKTSDNKELNASDRFNNSLKTIDINYKKVPNCTFLVIDDIVTSGATFFQTQRLLQQAGANDVIFLALGANV